MEKTRIITIPLPIWECYKRLPNLMQDLGWRKVRTDPKTHFLWWRKGEDWLLKRRHDLYISLYAQGSDGTKVVATVKDGRIAWGGSDLIDEDLLQAVDYMEDQLGQKVVAG